MAPIPISGLADAAIFFATGFIVECAFALAIIGLAEVVGRLSEKGN